MIGALPTTTSLFPTRPLPAAPAVGRPVGPGWLEGLGEHGPATLRADVLPGQRGLSVQQHAARVLDALVG